jgi:hypothetical protein
MAVICTYFTDLDAGRGDSIKKELEGIKIVAV